jgi:hypothetical protein
MSGTQTWDTASVDSPETRLGGRTSGHRMCRFSLSNDVDSRHGTDKRSSRKSGPCFECDECCRASGSVDLTGSDRTHLGPLPQDNLRHPAFGSRAKDGASGRWSQEVVHGQEGRRVLPVLGDMPSACLGICLFGGSHICFGVRLSVFCRYLSGHLCNMRSMNRVFSALCFNSAQLLFFCAEHYKRHHAPGANIFAYA